MRLSFRSLVSAALSLLVALFATVTAHAQDLNALLTKALEGSKTPAVAALEIRDGKIAQEAVLGQRRNDGVDPAQPDDVWLIGSNGKPITAALVARLVDRGLLSWDAPLESMLPELQATMRPEYRKVTLVQLLSHRAGLPENTRDLKSFDGFHLDTRPLPQQRLAYVAKTLAEAPIATPGSKVSYSNTGFIIAAAIAERVTRSNYEDLMRRELFEPLGMTRVGYGTTHLGQVMGHVRGKPVARARDSNPLMFAPAGNLHMSLRDWAAFCLDQLAAQRGAGKLLSPASYKLMQTLLPGGEGSVGWGVQAGIAGRKGPVLVHGGSDGNWFAMVVLFPESGRGALVAANAGPDMGGDKAVQAVLMALLPEKN